MSKTWGSATAPNRVARRAYLLSPGAVYAQETDTGANDEVTGTVVGRLRVLHVIAQLRRGGPLQALIAAKKQSRLQCEHHIVSIRPADRRACAQAAEVGIAGTSAPDAAHLRGLMAGADIVQVHFWNSPEIHALLASDLPPIRLLLWCHVNGHAAPHIIPAPLLGRSDMVVALASSTLDLPAFRAVDPRRVALVSSFADFTRILGLRPVPHDGFHVGYIGTVNFAKLHEAFVHMCAAVKVPSARFLICGDGGAEAILKRQASELGIFDRCEFHDHAEDIRPILARLDVFGYPLTADTFATAELALQEAMYAGIPPVVFAHGGPGQMVTNGKTGFVVQSQSDYVAAIEFLYRNASERKRLGENSARQMRERLQRSSCESDAVYLRLMKYSKRPHAHIETEDRAELPQARRDRGAWSFVRSLDGISDADFATSLTATGDAQAEAAEVRITQSSADIQDVVLHYRLRNPDDPHLRLWAGLILRKRGRFALAASEFSASIALGCGSPRVRHYLLDSVRIAQSDLPPTASNVVQNVMEL